MIALGAAMGAFNGLLSAKFKINPMLTTLGTMYLYTGLGIIKPEGTTVNGFPGDYLVLGSGYVFAISDQRIQYVPFGERVEGFHLRRAAFRRNGVE